MPPSSMPGLDVARSKARWRMAACIGEHDGVYAVGRPLTTPLEHAYAAVLACGDRSALGGMSALALRDVPTAVWPAKPVVLVAGARRARKHVEIHRCSTLTRADAKPYQGIPALTTERALLEVANDSRTPAKQLRRLVQGALRSKRTSHTKLHQLLERHPNSRLAAVVNPRHETKSPAEDDFVTFCAQHNLPTPQTLATPFGYEVDAWFPEERVIVEVDSEEWHLSLEALKVDRARDRHHAAQNVLTLRLLTHDLTAPEAERLHGIFTDRRARAGHG